MFRMLKKHLGLGVAVCAASASLIAAAPQAHATLDDPFLVRVRGIAVLPRDHADVNLGGTTDIDPEYTIEVDFSYFFTENIAVELIAATTEHDAAWVVGGSRVELGSVQLLPPTLTLQYHFFPDKKIKPYVGAGINYTWFFNEESPAGLDVDYEGSFGLALQAGVDYKITDSVYLNFDVKKLFLNTDATVQAGPTTITADVDVDPWIIGIGVGYRF